MRSNYKGAIVEKIEHPTTKRAGVVRLDKRSMTFFAREDDSDLTAEPFASKDGAKVHAWLRVRLGHTTQKDRLDWVPVIEIKNDSKSGYRYRGEENMHGEQLDVEIDRFWIALTQDEREWRKITWVEGDLKSSGSIPENDRYAQSRRFGQGPKSTELTSWNKPFVLPSFLREGQVVVPYTPELWKGLLQVIRQIAATRELLKEMIGTKDGIAAVTEIGAGRQTLRLAQPKEKP